MVNAFSQGASGVAAGFDRLERTAVRIARDGAGDGAAQNAVDLLRASHQVRANLAVVRTADALTTSILDVYA